MITTLDTRNYKDQYSANNIQDNINKFINQFKDCPLINGILLKDLTITAPMIINNNYSFNHKLGRKPLGYIVTKQTITYTTIGTEYWDEQIIKFYIQDLALLPITFDVWIF